MNIESKIWGHSNTGIKRHAYSNGSALCRKSMETPAWLAERGTGMDYCEAKGASMCTNCDTKFNAELEREEQYQKRRAASTEPGTGEGDYLPSADDVTRPRWAKTDPRCTCLMLGSDYEHHNLCPTLRADPAAEVRTHHYNATGGQRFIAGRGWVNHCQVCQAPEGTGDHFHNPATPRHTTNEEDSLPIDNGPLTERQTAIIGHARAGLRYRKVAEKLGVSEVLVRQEVVTINRKLRAATLQQAIGIYATAQAYREVANALDYASRAHPEQDGVAEDHVNHVLMALAAVYRDRAVRLLPQ